MSHGEINLAGEIQVLSFGKFPRQFPNLFLTPYQTRDFFTKQNWSTVAAFQTRNTMHRAGVGRYYPPYVAQAVFKQVPRNTLAIAPLFFEEAFWCNACDNMATEKDCPHLKEERVLLSGTALRELLSENKPIPDHFSRKEVIAVLKEYYHDKFPL